MFLSCLNKLCYVCKVCAKWINGSIATIWRVCRLCPTAWCCATVYHWSIVWTCKVGTPATRIDFYIDSQSIHASIPRHFKNLLYVPLYCSPVHCYWILLDKCSAMHCIFSLIQMRCQSERTCSPWWMRHVFSRIKGGCYNLLLAIKNTEWPHRGQARAVTRCLKASNLMGYTSSKWLQI